MAEEADEVACLAPFNMPLIGGHVGIGVPLGGEQDSGHLAGLLATGLRVTIAHQLVDTGGGSIGTGKGWSTMRLQSLVKSVALAVGLIACGRDGGSGGLHGPGTGAGGGGSIGGDSGSAARGGASWEAGGSGEAGAGAGGASVETGVSGGAGGHLDSAATGGTGVGTGGSGGTGGNSDSAAMGGTGVEPGGSGGAGGRMDGLAVDDARTGSGGVSGRDTGETASGGEGGSPGTGGDGATPGTDSSARAKFCNNLVKGGGADFVGYLSFEGDGVGKTTWYARSDECSPCESIPAGKILSFEFGDEIDQMADIQQKLEIGGEYTLVAELGDSTGKPIIALYMAKPGFRCEDLFF
jgi:hypothetical protein